MEVPKIAFGICWLWHSDMSNTCVCILLMMIGWTWKCCLWLVILTGTWSGAIIWRCCDWSVQLCGEDGKLRSAALATVSECRGQPASNNTEPHVWIQTATCRTDVWAHAAVGSASYTRGGKYCCSSVMQLSYAV